MCPSSLHTSDSTIHPHYPHQVAGHLRGSNPDDRQPFLLQCQLTFNSYPQHYTSNSSKVFFAISYLKKSTLEWFEIGVMESDPRLALTWHASWPEFLSEICTHFRPLNPTGTAEIELHHLFMQSNSHISEYLVRFNMLAS